MDLNSDIYKKTHYLIIYSKYLEEKKSSYINILRRKSSYILNKNNLILSWSQHQNEYYENLNSKFIIMKNVIIMEDKFDLNLFYVRDSNSLVFGEKTKKKFCSNSMFYKKFPHNFEILEISEKKTIKNEINQKYYNYYVANLKIPLEYNLYNKNKNIYY